MEDLREQIRDLVDTVHATQRKVNKIEKALLGDPLEQRVGILETVKEQNYKLTEHEDLLVVLNDKVEKNKLGWGKISGAAATGGGVGFSINSWHDILEWFKHLV